LANLHDIVVPGPVPWWPLAPGWYAVALTLLVLLLWAGIAIQRRRRAGRYRRAALAELAALRQAARDPAQRAGALDALPVLLKRVALACWPRERVARLSGAGWWRLLDLSGGGDRFTGTHGPTLSRVAYQRDPAIGDRQIEALLRAAGRWIRRHRCGPSAG
jgi:hypothetical protein